MKRFGRLIGILSAIVFGVLLLVFSAKAKNGAFMGVMLCGRVVIPSLFPFTVCALFLQNADFLRFFDRLSPITTKIFGLNGRGVGLWVLSLIGGYPIGAKLLSQSVEKREIAPETAGKMLGYCVNAGPAFIITAVGVNAFSSKTIGVILLCSHIFASFLVLCLNRFLYGNIEVKAKMQTTPSFSDNFVLSTANAASAIMNVCGFVILFSCVIAFFEQNEKLSGLGLLLEVTNGVNNSKNVFVVSFLLGFSGVSIWCQVLAMTRNIKMNFLHFVLCRILNGGLSLVITVFIFKVFNVSLPTFSFGGMKGEVFSNSPQVSACLLIMAIVFAISITAKNFAGKITEDIV